MSADQPLRQHILTLLDGRDAHADFTAAVSGVPTDLRGIAPAGLPYSAWQILDHLYRAQHDILDFSINPSYKELKWPDDYWPASAAPPTSEAWDDTVAAYQRDTDAMKKLVRDQATDLFATIPHGTGQTYLREALLVADHAAYHIGQLVLVRRLLGIWPTAR